MRTDVAIGDFIYDHCICLDDEEIRIHIMKFQILDISQKGELKLKNLDEKHPHEQREGWETEEYMYINSLSLTYESALNKAKNELFKMAKLVNEFEQEEGEENVSE